MHNRGRVVTMSDEERFAKYFEDGIPDDELAEGARAELDDLLQLFAASSTWEQPPPELGDDVVAGIRAAGPAVAVPSSPGAPTAATAPALQPHAFPETQRRRWLRPVLAAAAAVVIVAALGAVLTSRGNPDGRSFALAATEVVPGAGGRATVVETGSGLSISLSIDGLPPAEPGTFYQAWMRGEAGSVPIGTFHARRDDGRIELWSGVDVGDYPTMTVTIQQEGAGPESSGVVVLRGDLPQPSRQP
jgi:hypothetical protein